MLTNTVPVPVVATSVYNLIRIYLSQTEREAVENHDQQLKANVLFQVRDTNAGDVLIGDAANQDFALPPAGSANVTNTQEFNKQSLTDIYVRGSLGDNVTIVILPSSN